MPQAVAAWAATAVTGFTSFGSAAYAGYGAIAAYGAVYATAFAATAYGLSTAASKLQAKQTNESGGFQARDMIIASAKAPEVVVYGQAWVGGVMMYANQKHSTSTKDNFEVYKSVIHAAHECADIVDLRYDNDLLTDAGEIDWGAGHVTSGKYYVLNGGVYAVSLEKHLGTSTQTQSTLLSDFTADFPGSTYRARGRAYTVHKFVYFSTTSNTPEAIFYSGVPQNIRALVKGRKIYDPRLDSSNGGSGSMRFNTPSGWAWSDNPILIYTDYRTQYMNVPFARMDWDWIRAQAAICDATVVIPVSTTQKRYTCNGALSLGATHGDNCDAILASCMGSCPKVNGKWRPTAGAYITSDVTITEDDIVGEVTMTASVQREDRYNTVRSVYYSPEDYAQEIDALEMTSGTYVTRDAGQTLIKSLALGMVNTEYQAQRIEYKTLLQSDRQIGCVVPMRWTGLKIAIGTRVSLNYSKFGWVGKTFRCTNWKLGGDAPISIVLREDDSAGWADPAEVAYSTRDDQGVVTPGVVELPTPSPDAGESGEVTARNANFELGPWYWQFPDHIGQWGVAHQGTWSARAYGAAGTGASANDTFYPCREGDVFTFGGWVATDGTWAGANVHWRVEWFDSAFASVGTAATDDAVTTVGSGWVQLLGKGYAPAGAEFVRLEYVWTSQTTGVAYYDDGFLWKGISTVDTPDVNPESIISGSSIESAGPVTVNGTEGYKTIQTITVDPGVATNSDSFLEISLAFEFSVDVSTGQQYGIQLYVDGTPDASTFRADFLDGSFAWPATRSYFWLVDVPATSATYTARLTKATSNGKTFSLVNIFMSGKVLKKAQ